MSAHPPILPPPLRALAALGALLVIAQLVFLAEPALAGRVSAVVSDKAAHMLVFGTLALLLWAALGGRWPLAAFGLALAVGAVDEAVQYFTPGRVADARDLLADAVGAAAMLLSLSMQAPAPLTGAAPPLFTHGG